MLNIQKNSEKIQRR